MTKEKTLGRSITVDRTFHAIVKEKLRQKKMSHASTLAPVPSSYETSFEQPGTILRSPPEQKALEVSPGLIVKESEEAPLRPCKRTRGMNLKVEADDLKLGNSPKPPTARVCPVSPVQAASPGGEGPSNGGNFSASSRLYPDNVSILNCDVYPKAYEVLQKLVPPADLLIYRKMPLELLKQGAATRVLQSLILFTEVERRMSEMSQTLALGREKELNLQAELKASKAKVAEQEAKLVVYESTNGHLQRLLETVCSTQEAALACVDKEVKAAKEKIEAVGAELAAKQDNSTTSLMDEAEKRASEPEEELGH